MSDAPDPVAALQDALHDHGMSLGKGALAIELAALAVSQKANALLLALPAMLQAAKADGYDYGVDTCTAAFAAAAVLDVANPFRVAAADELARETREQGHQ